jgi:hypothetical protein
MSTSGQDRMGRPAGAHPARTRSQPALQVLPGDGRGHGFAASRSTVTQLRLRDGEWLIADVPETLPPRGPVRAELRNAGRSVIGQYSPQRGDSGSFSIVTVPPGSIDARLGLAVLHRRGDGATTVYCPTDQISRAAARAVSLLASEAQSATGIVSVTIARVNHAHFGAGLHPALLRGYRGHVVIWVCAEAITVGAAEVLSTLCTAHTSCRPTTAWAS